MPSRREFFTWSAAGAFLLAAGDARGAATPAISPWITIHPDGRVTLVSTAVDMGQGARTGQAQVLADELDVPWEAITVVMAPDADPFRFDGELYSGGSQSVRTRFATMRRAAATARGQLVSAAAARWSVPAADCQASLGQVVHAPSGRKLGYGELAAEAARLP